MHIIKKKGSKTQEKQWHAGEGEDKKPCKEIHKIKLAAFTMPATYRLVGRAVHGELEVLRDLARLCIRKPRHHIHLLLPRKQNKNKQGKKAKTQKHKNRLETKTTAT